MATPFHCRTCRETAKNQSDWLFHMVSHGHSLKIRHPQHFESWLAEMRLTGDVMVISGLENVDNSMLLEFISGNLRRFSNIVFFKPQANICLIVCDKMELSQFLSKPLPHVFHELKFKLYDRISSDEWSSFFSAKPDNRPTPPASSQPTPTSSSTSVSNNSKRRRSYSDEDDEISLSENGKRPHYDNSRHQRPVKPSTSASSSSNYNNPPSPDESVTYDPSVPLDNDLYGATEDEWNIQEIPAPKTKPHFLDSRSSKKAPAPSTPSGEPPNSKFTLKDDLAAELEHIYHAVMLPEDARDVRKRFLEFLKEFLRKIRFPQCELIPVGDDFLDFKVENDWFSVFVDSKGLINPPRLGPEGVVSEQQTDMDKIRSPLFQGLKRLESEGKLTDVKCEGAEKLRFNYVEEKLKCKLIFRPFKQAQTARLCKQLFYMNEEASYLLILVHYWASQYSGFHARGSTNPYIFAWLINFFLMLKGSLPPVARLQEQCKYQIKDGELNVAFVYDESNFSRDVEMSILRKGQSEAILENLYDWFTFMDDLFTDTMTKGTNGRHNLLCPRYGELIDKRKFRVCQEHFQPKKKNLSSDQKNVRKLWKEDLIRIGFDESTWNILKDLRMEETLALQHPLYIGENIGNTFDPPFSKFFFKIVKETRRKLKRIVFRKDEHRSIITALKPSPE